MLHVVGLRGYSRSVVPDCYGRGHGRGGGADRNGVNFYLLFRQFFSGGFCGVSWGFAAVGDEGERRVGGARVGEGRDRWFGSSYGAFSDDYVARLVGHGEAAWFVRA